MYSNNAHIQKAISHFVSEWQSDKCRGVGNFAPFLPLNWLPWQRPLRNWKNWTCSRKFTQITSIWWKDRENRSSRYWDSFAPNKKRIKLENTWQRLAYSPLGAVVSPPSEYLWKTLTYWSPECLTAPSHSKHRWTKRGNYYRRWPYIFFCLKLRGD